jgi:hypothetical protein
MFYLLKGITARPEYITSTIGNVASSGTATSCQQVDQQPWEAGHRLQLAANGETVPAQQGHLARTLQAGLWMGGLWAPASSLPISWGTCL